MGSHSRGWELCKTHRCSAPPLAFRYSLSLDFQVIMAGVAHLTEAGHKEVIAPMIGWGVLLDVGKLHKLSRRRERNARRGDRLCSLPLRSGTWHPEAPCHIKARGHPHPGNHASQDLALVRFPEHASFQILLAVPVYTARPEPRALRGPSRPFAALLGWGEQRMLEKRK